MTDGPHVLKWTYLLHEVEIDGTIVAGSGPITGDILMLRADAGFVHFTSAVPGLDGTRHDTVACEGYNDGIVYPADGWGYANHIEDSWPLPGKPLGDVFMVDGRPLHGGDHVRLTGRLMIENGHPDLTPGSPWIELHPFDYDFITLLPPEPDSGTLAVVAPLYSRASYVDIKWPNRPPPAGTVDLSSLQTEIRGNLELLAAYPPTGYSELVIENSTAVPTDQVRTIDFDQAARSLTVSATVTSLGDPSADLWSQRAVFQARYAFIYSELGLQSEPAVVPVDAPSAITIIATDGSTGARVDGAEVELNGVAVGLTGAAFTDTFNGAWVDTVRIGVDGSARQSWEWVAPKGSVTVRSRDNPPVSMELIFEKPPAPDR